MFDMPYTMWKVIITNSDGHSQISDGYVGQLTQYIHNSPVGLCRTSLC